MSRLVEKAKYPKGVKGQKKREATTRRRMKIVPPLVLVTINRRSLV